MATQAQRIADVERELDELERQHVEPAETVKRLALLGAVEQMLAELDAATRPVAPPRPPRHLHAVDGAS